MYTNLEKLLYWIKERENIRLKREAGLPKPWTADPILQSYRFCNVRREHDRVTKWIRQNWSHPQHENFTLAMVIARFFNRPETLDYIGFPFEWNSEMYRDGLHALEETGKRVFNAAYVVSTNGVVMDKIDYVVDRILQPFSERSKVNFTTCWNAYSWLTRSNGIGDFMAGQIIADLKNTMGHELMAATDFMSFVVAGPGSMRGMNRLLGQDIKKRISPTDFSQNILRLKREIEDGLEMHLDGQDIQNCLCEFDKYMRAHLKEGRPKQSYPGASDG